MSLNKDFNIHRLERYLSLTWESGAIPVVVLTKSDLCDNVYRKLQVVNSIALGVDVVVTSSIEPDGYKQISKYIKPGCTVALLGSSGVGKSSLINCLMGGEFLNTKEIRIDDDKGRHATTRRELFLISGGGIVIDTPGMRELGMWDVSEGLDKSFADIEAYFENVIFVIVLTPQNQAVLSGKLLLIKNFRLKDGNPIVGLKLKQYLQTIKANT